MIRILALNRNMTALQERHLLRRLPADEQLAVQRFRRHADRHRSLVGRATVRMLLGRQLGMAASAVPLTQGRFGKPVLGDAAGHVEFSVSHSGEWILVALGEHAMGIDIEQHRDDIDPALVESCFTPAEQSRIRTGADFFRYWTYKEAALKATGAGFSLPPSQFEVIEGEPESRIGGHRDLLQCRLARLPAPTGYSASLGTLGAAPSWTLQTHDLDELLSAPSGSDPLQPAH